MSLLARLALVEDRSIASNPGRLSVERLRYATHFPLWPVGLVFGLMASAGWVAVRPTFWPLLVFALALNFSYWYRVKLRFQFGCVNPGKVVSTEPFLLAVYTDLANGNVEAPYPVVKILSHTTPRGTGLAMGDKCATVAMYNGAASAEHCEDFDPIMVDCATSDNATLESVLRAIPAEEWVELEAGLKEIPQPLKRGIYPLKHGR